MAIKCLRLIIHLWSRTTNSRPQVPQRPEMPPAAKRLYYIGGILLVIAGILALIYVAKLMFFTTQTIKDLGG